MTYEDWKNRRRWAVLNDAEINSTYRRVGNAIERADYEFDMGNTGVFVVDRSSGQIVYRGQGGQDVW